MATKRASNFSPAEELHFLEIIAKHKDIIECKRSDSESNIKKKKTWEKIALEFNACSLTNRTPDILVNKYRNMKKRTKKKIADNKSSFYGTGGGPKNINPLTDVDQRIEEMAGKQISGLPSQFDDDVEIRASSSNAQESEEIIFLTSDSPVLIENAEEQGEDDKENQVDWTKYTPQTIRTPRTKALRPGRQTLSGKMASWSKQKLQNEEVRERHAEEIHNLKMHQMREKHELELQIMRDEAELRKELTKEKHALELQVIKKSL